MGKISYLAKKGNQNLNNYEDKMDDDLYTEDEDIGNDDILDDDDNED